MSDYFSLGSYSRPVSDVPDGQMWFDRGLVWLFAYNHEEAIVCFENALEADPACALAWGIAYAIGPNYNKPWEFFTAEEKAPALERAHTALNAGFPLENAKPVERALIQALASLEPLAMLRLNGVWKLLHNPAKLEATKFQISSQSKTTLLPCTGVPFFRHEFSRIVD